MGPDLDPGQNPNHSNITNLLHISSFPDPWHFGTDPDADADPRNRSFNQRIRLRIRFRMRIRLRILLLRIRMRIPEAQKHRDPTDPDPDADPEHCKVNTVPVPTTHRDAQLHYVNILFLF
jgi:hypothetical protein